MARETTWFTQILKLEIMKIVISSCLTCPTKIITFLSFMTRTCMKNYTENAQALFKPALRPV